MEFLAGTVLLLIPVVYLTLTLGELQAATFAVHTAAREAARAAVTADDGETASARARAAVDLAMTDQGIGGAAQLRLACSADPCRAEPDDPASVTAEVAVAVPLPGVPGFLDAVLPMRVPVSARVVAPVDPYRADP